MEDVTSARGLHVLTVAAWMGGVTFITTALPPAVKRFESAAVRDVYSEKHRP